MNRLQRLTSILIFLQSKRIVKASEIAGKYSISQRTVYRDMRSLEEAGVPIGIEQGKGYFILRGYHLPPVMFTNAEAAALLTGAKLMSKLGDNSLIKEFSNALDKIKAVLKESDKEKIEELDKAVYISGSDLKKIDHYPNGWISNLQLAMACKNEVKISYFSLFKNEDTVRIVCPIGLCYYANAWHLIAFCKLRNDYRDFRVDRIKDLKTLDSVFCSGELNSLDEYLKKLSCSENLTKVVLRFPKEIAQYIYEQKFLYGFVDEKEFESKVEITFLTSSLDYIARWLMAYSCSVEILEPLELKEITVSLSKAAYENFIQQLN